MMRQKNPFKKEKYKSQKTSRIVSLVGTYTLLTILSLVWIIPILWVVLQAFRGDSGSVDGTFFPSSFGVINFQKLFTSSYYGAEYAYLRWFGNTLIVSIICCILSTFLILSVAYCMSKLRFKLRKPFMNLSMILGLFPGFMSMIAIYFLLKAIGLSGQTEEKAWLNLVGLIIAYSAGSGMGYQVAKGFFDVVPSSLVESAKLDGCSNFKIFCKIILPLSKPIIIYTALTSFTGPWMDFIFAKVIIGTGAPEMWTVSVGLYSLLFGEQPDASLFTEFCAGCTIVAIPITTLFMCLQKYYVEGVTAGAVKG